MHTEIVNKQRNYFKENSHSTLSFRLEQLQKLKKIINQNEEDICQAILKDLNRPIQETYLSELHIIYGEIKYFQRNLKKLMKKKKAYYNINTLFDKMYYTNDPKGTTLIISPWNYPLYLSIVPLIANICSGNTTILNLSPRTPKINKLLYKLINQAFDSNYIFVLDPSNTHYEITKQNFDHIFFTGSQEVGKIIMESASKHLTPVTLELGGKSPVVITKNANIKKAVKTILWGKILNSSQTCVAPDFVLIDENLYDLFIEEIDYQINGYKKESRSLVDQKHQDITNQLLGENTIKSYQLNGIELHLTDGFTSYTVDQELFCPILPIIKFKNINETLTYIKYPLALYIFTQNIKEQNYIIQNTLSGGVMINGTVKHLSNNKLPFGGIKTSGFGRYHGKFGFEELTYKRSVLKTNFFDPFFIYPPYIKQKKLMKLLKFINLFE